MNKEEERQRQLKTKRELLRENVAKKSGDFHKLFTSPIGAKVLKYLEDEFDQEEIFEKGVPDGTAYNLGRRDVCVYIRQMIRYKENAARTELEG